MAVEAVRPGGQANDPRARRDRARRSNLGILDHDSLVDRNAEPIGREQIQIGLGFAALDMLAAAVDMLPERLGEAEVGEMGMEPASRARRSHGDWQICPQRAYEVDRAGDCPHAFLERADGLSLAPFVELGRQRASDSLLDRGYELLAGEADELLQRLLDGDVMAK